MKKNKISKMVKMIQIKKLTKNKTIQTKTITKISNNSNGTLKMSKRNSRRKSKPQRNQSKRPNLSINRTKNKHQPQRTIKKDFKSKKPSNQTAMTTNNLNKPIPMDSLTSTVSLSTKNLKLKSKLKGVEIHRRNKNSNTSQKIKKGVKLTNKAVKTSQL